MPSGGRRKGAGHAALDETLILMSAFMCLQVGSLTQHVFRCGYGNVFNNVGDEPFAYKPKATFDNLLQLETPSSFCSRRNLVPGQGSLTCRQTCINFNNVATRSAGLNT